MPNVRKEWAKFLAPARFCHNFSYSYVIFWKKIIKTRTFFKIVLLDNINFFSASANESWYSSDRKIKWTRQVHTGPVYFVTVLHEAKEVSLQCALTRISLQTNIIDTQVHVPIGNTISETSLALSRESLPQRVIFSFAPCAYVTYTRINWCSSFTIDDVIAIARRALSLKRTASERASSHVNSIPLEDISRNPSERRRKAKKTHARAPPPPLRLF